MTGAGHRGAAGAVAAGAALAAVLAGCTGPPAAPVTLAAAGAPGRAPAFTDTRDPGARVLHLDAQARRADIGTVVPRLPNRGYREVTVGVATQSGGRLLLARDGDGERTLRTPRAGSSSPPPAAALTVVDPGRTDALSPRLRSFRIGAEIRLDADTTGPGDDGDNVLQRGLFSDPAQFKLQVDGGRPSCLVRGDAGEVLVRWRTQLRRGVWYALACTRTDRQVTLRVQLLAGRHSPVARSVVGRTGAIVFRPRSRPLAVGAKVSADGQVVRSSTDQLNGEVDDAFLEYR